MPAYPLMRDPFAWFFIFAPKDTDDWGIRKVKERGRWEEKKKWWRNRGRWGKTGKESFKVLKKKFPTSKHFILLPKKKKKSFLLLKPKDQGISFMLGSVGT